MIVLLAGMIIIGGLGDGIAGIGVDMLAKRWIAAVVVSVIILEEGAPCSHAGDVRSCRHYQCLILTCRLSCGMTW